jgi:hypothetical protein
LFEGCIRIEGKLPLRFSKKKYLIWKMCKPSHAKLPPQYLRHFDENMAISSRYKTMKKLDFFIRKIKLLKAVHGAVLWKGDTVEYSF